MLTATFLNYPLNQRPDERHVFTALQSLFESHPPAAYAGIFEQAAKRRIGRNFNVTVTADRFEIRRVMQVNTEPPLAAIYTCTWSGQAKPLAQPFTNARVKPRYRLNLKTGGCTLISS